MKKTTIRQFVLFTVTLLIFRIFLDILYASVIARYWEYMGFVFDLNSIKFIESYCIFFILTLSLKYRAKKPSHVYLLVMFIGVIAPLLSMYGLADQSRETVYFVVLGYFLVFLFSKGKPFYIPQLKKASWIGIFIAFVSVIFVMSWFLFRGGLSYFNLDLTKVYAYRRMASSSFNVGLMIYYNTWAVKVFSIALFSYFLYKHCYKSALIIFMLQILFFSMTGHKSTLFYPFIILFFYRYFKKSNQLSRIPTAICFIWAVSYGLYILFDFRLFLSLFVRRTFFVIAKNTFDYYTYFSINPKVFWSNSILSKFLTYPYHVNPALLIGQWRSTDSHVNNTFLSTGYMHAGLLGIIVYGVLCGLLLRLIDSLSTRTPLWFSLSITFVPMFSLIMSADLFTALLTHGIAASCIMLWLLREGTTAQQKSVLRKL